MYLQIIRSCCLEVAFFAVINQAKVIFLEIDRTATPEGSSWGPSRFFREHGYRLTDIELTELDIILALLDGEKVGK